MVSTPDGVEVKSVYFEETPKIGNGVKIRTIVENTDSSAKEDVSIGASINDVRVPDIILSRIEGSSSRSFSVQFEVPENTEVMLVNIGGVEVDRKVEKPLFGDLVTLGGIGLVAVGGIWQGYKTLKWAKKRWSNTDGVDVGEGGGGE